MRRLIDAVTGEVMLSQLEVADTFWKRFKGLQFRKALPPDAGLMLTPCSSLHTCFMRFPIDVIMLDKEWGVVGIRKQVRPWKAVVCVPQTKSVIELASGNERWKVGQQLKVNNDTEGCSR